MMLKEFEYQGEWWLPNQIEIRIPGTLKFSQNEGAKLELIGSFKESKNRHIFTNPEIILGISSGGKIITLYRCFETESIVNIPGSLRSSFFVQTIFIGTHFNEIQETKFKKMRIHFSNLDEWINISGINIRSEDKGCLIKYKMPESIEANIKNGFKILLNPRMQTQSMSFAQKEIKIQQKWDIVIEPINDKHFEDYIEIMYTIRNFLSLGISEVINPTNIEGIKETDNQPSRIEVFYKLPQLQVSRIKIPHEMLFTFKSISSNFESYIQNWYNLIESIRTLYDLYFGVLYSPKMYLRLQFLSLVQGIESYQRKKGKMRYIINPKKHKQQVEKILESTYSEFRDWLRMELSNSNQPSLQDRLRDIIDSNLQIFGDYLESHEDQYEFIRKVKDSRHFYIHGDKEDERKAIPEGELYPYIWRLKILAEILLLKELGFQEDEIIGFLDRRYLYEKNQWSNSRVR